MPNHCQNGNGWRFRYYQMGSLPVRTPVEFGPLAIGVPRCHRIDRCSAHAKGILRVGIPVPENIPRNIPGSKSSQTRMIAWSRENIPNIPKIPNIHGIPWMRVSCVRSHARKGASRKARLVTICHRLREGPFFLVLEGERRFGGFPFGLHRKGPKKGLFWALSSMPSNRPVQRTRKGYLARGNPGFRREARSTRGHKFRIILSWSQRRLFPRF